MIEQQDAGALKLMLIEISQSEAALEGLIFFHRTPGTPTPSGNYPAGLQRYVTRGSSKSLLPSSVTSSLFLVERYFPWVKFHSKRPVKLTITVETIDYYQNYRLLAKVLIIIETIGYNRLLSKQSISMHIEYCWVLSKLETSVNNNDTIDYCFHEWEQSVLFNH